MKQVTASAELNAIEKTVGRHTVRIQREGNAFVYDVLRAGQLFAVGFDLLSQTQGAALNAIAARYGEER